MEESTASLRAFLLTRLGELGLSQSELARISGVSTSDISGIMQGRIKLPGADKRRRLAKAIGVSHLDLLVAAGEITPDELGDRAGIVERSADDPKEQLIQMVRETPMPPQYVRSLMRMMESWQEDHRRSQASRKAPGE